MVGGRDDRRLEPNDRDSLQKRESLKLGTMGAFYRIPRTG